MVDGNCSGDAGFEKKFSFWEFMRFLMPPVLSMVFVSMYTIVDGIFVSRYAGPVSLAAINIGLPLINLSAGFGVMMACGGSSVISMLMGAKRKSSACQAFSLIVYFSLALALLFSVFGLFFLDGIVGLLGASQVLLHDARIYALGIILTAPFFVAKILFEYFARNDGDYGFSMFISVVGGLVNIVLDYVLIRVFSLGIAGAVIATGIGIGVSSFIGLWYFLFRSKNLRFKKPSFDGKLISSSCFNGSSEMVSELSTGVTTVIFNTIALRYGSELGVSSLSVLLYAHFLMTSVYLGFSFGSAPIFSYNFGAKNSSNIKNAMSHSIRFVGISSIVVFASSFVFSSSIVSLFVDPSSDMFEMSKNALKIFSFTFLFVGFNIFTSGFFTAVGQGRISAIISFCRTFVFVVIWAVCLPGIFRLDGLWLVLPFSEGCCFFVSLYFLRHFDIEQDPLKLAVG